MTNIKISKNFTWTEAIQSKTAGEARINNMTQDAVIKNNIFYLANLICQPVRNYLREPLKINSFYRSPELNTLIGGSKQSAHLRGLAVDIDDTYLVKNGSNLNNRDIFYFIKDNLNFDVLIWEFGNVEKPDWIHVSTKPLYQSFANRHLVLKAIKEDGKTKYIKFK